MLATPVVDVVKITPTRNDNAIVTVICPWCGRKHVHGLPAGETTVGHRVAHCDRDTEHLGYEIRLVPVGAA